MRINEMTIVMNAGSSNATHPAAVIVTVSGRFGYVILGSCKEKGRLFALLLRALLNIPPRPARKLLMLAKSTVGFEITHSMRIQSIIYDKTIRFDRRIAPVPRVFAACELLAILSNRAHD